MPSFQDGGPRGFERGFEVEKIIGATDTENGELMFLVKWYVYLICIFKVSSVFSC